MNARDFRLIASPRDDYPHGVMLELYGPDLQAALAVNTACRPSSEWPCGWTPFAWYADRSAALEDVRSRRDVNLETAKHAAAQGQVWAELAARLEADG